MLVKVNDINEGLLDEISQALETKEPLTLLINSRGGDLEVAYSIYEMLRNAETEVHAKVQGNCFSSATIILLGVKKENRTATKLSQFLIHSPILNNLGGVNLSQSEAITDYLSEEYNRLMNLYVDRLAIKDKTTINNLMRNETTIDAEQAYVLGFIGGVEDYKNQIYNRMNLLNKVLLRLLNESEEKTIKTENGEYPIEGDLAVGVKIDAPNGTYLEEATQTKFVVEDGVVTDVEPQIATEPIEPTTEETEPIAETNVTNAETEEQVVEEVKEQVVEEVEQAVEQVAETEPTDTDNLAKVLEQLSAKIAELEEKVLALQPTEEPKVEEEPQVENKVERRYWGYTPLNSSVRNSVSKEVVSGYWKR